MSTKAVDPYGFSFLNKWGLHSNSGTKVSAKIINVIALTAESIKTLWSLDHWTDSVISNLSILLMRDIQ